MHIQNQDSLVNLINRTTFRRIIAVIGPVREIFFYHTFVFLLRHDFKLLPDWSSTISSN